LVGICGRQGRGLHWDIGHLKFFSVSIKRDQSIARFFGR
jgi:hypothetical protein